jgi:hypothetical protein
MKNTMPTNKPTRRAALRLVLSAIVLPVGAVRANTLPEVTVWKDPKCACCESWIGYMRQSGFRVSVHETTDMASVKMTQGVRESLQSCHTASIGGYVIEGHVRAGDIRRLLAEQPQAKGLAVPGMPRSAPGMDQTGEPYTVILFGSASGSRPYAHHTGSEDSHAL